MEGDWRGVGELLEQNADPNVEDEKGKLALHAAAFTGSVEVLRRLLEARADANMSESSSGDRPLQIAAWQGHRQAVDLLLDRSANTDAPDGRGWTPLCSAASQGHTAIVQALLARGADPNKKVTVERWGSVAPLEVAKAQRHRDIVEALQAALAARKDKASASSLAAAILPAPGANGAGAIAANSPAARAGRAGHLSRLCAGCCSICGPATPGTRR
ncbi:unnamed protein product [Prorocentrum cordatum]|nr:unnamed protein product [Polarella glacialis]